MQSPGGWAAIGSLIWCSAIQNFEVEKYGNATKLYHHIYKSLVTIYDVFSKNPSRFHQEMDNVSSSIFRMLVEDKITDDQFEKLLKRKDDLLERANTQQPPLTPKTLRIFSRKQ